MNKCQETTSDTLEKIWRRIELLLKTTRKTCFHHLPVVIANQSASWYWDIRTMTVILISAFLVLNRRLLTHIWRISICRYQFQSRRVFANFEFHLFPKAIITCEMPIFHWNVYLKYMEIKCTSIYLRHIIVLYLTHELNWVTAVICSGERVFQKTASRNSDVCI